jgi:hypothetical protein
VSKLILEGEVQKIMIKNQRRKNTIPFSTALFAEVLIESKDLQSTREKI